jgi:hypothetical protein
MNRRSLSRALAPVVRGFSALVALTAGLWVATPAIAQPQLTIGFDLGGTVIVDNVSVEDLNPTLGIVDFDGVYGTAGYDLKGRLCQICAPGPTVAGQLMPPIYSLTLTDFTAEAVPASSLMSPLIMRFNSAPFVGAFAPGTAVASLEAEVDSSLDLAIAANTDRINAFESSITDGVTFATVNITPPTGAALPMGNPLHPVGPTPPTAYAVSGLGPMATPAFNDPIISGRLEIGLGQVGDQLILPGSLEIGFTAVPEPSSVVLCVLGTLGLAVFGCRRRAARKRPA